MSTSSLTKPVFRPITSDDHVFGPADAPVTLVMYGNYECLHCRRVYPEVAAIRAELGSRLRFVYRHFAIAADFPHAELAAEAAEAAGAQGRFWDMHEALSLRAPSLVREALVAEAERLHLDVARLEADLDARRYHDLVKERTKRAVASRVRSTPTFFVNGEYVEDPWDLDGLRALLHRP
jgi:formate-nitrite transporter family protein